MSDQSSNSNNANSGPSMTRGGLTYALYEDKACGACGADNWRGEKLALAFVESADAYMCPPCVNAYLAKKTTH